MELKRFHPSMIGEGEMVLSVGKKKTGKTTGLFDIIYEKRDTPEWVAFCGTANSNEALEHVMPSAFIHDGWNSEVMKSIIMHKEQRNYKRRRTGKKRLWTGVIIDDCAFDPKFFRDSTLKQVTMNSRWIGFSPTVITTQYPVTFHPSVLSQFDWFVLHREITQNNRRRLFDHYFPLDDFKLFNAIMDVATADWGALVIRNSGTSNRVEDNIFAWRPTIRDWHVNPRQKPWKLGSRSFWAFHHKNYNDRWHERRAEEQKSVTKQSGVKKRALVRIEPPMRDEEEEPPRKKSRKR